MGCMFRRRWRWHNGAWLVFAFFAFASRMLIVANSELVVVLLSILHESCSIIPCIEAFLLYPIWCSEPQWLIAVACGEIAKSGMHRFQRQK